MRYWVGSLYAAAAKISCLLPAASTSPQPSLLIPLRNFEVRSTIHPRGAEEAVQRVAFDFTVFGAVRTRSHTIKVSFHRSDYQFKRAAPQATRWPLNSWAGLTYLRSTSTVHPLSENITYSGVRFWVSWIWRSVLVLCRLHLVCRHLRTLTGVPFGIHSHWTGPLGWGGRQVPCGRRCRAEPVQSGA